MEVWLLLLKRRTHFRFKLFFLMREGEKIFEGHYDVRMEGGNLKRITFFFLSEMK